MPNRATGRLCLVEDSPAQDRQTNEADRLGEASAEPSIPVPIRLTIEEMLNVADDADLRAMMISLSTGRRSNSDRSADKIRSLHEVGKDLRRIAAGLNDRWIRANGPSS